MPATLDRVKTGLRSFFAPLQEAEQAKAAEAVETYDDLVARVADSIHTGDPHGLDQSEIKRITTEAGKDASGLEVDVSQRLRVLVNADTIQKAKDYAKTVEVAKAELAELKTVHLVEAQKAVGEVKRKIVAQEQIIRRKLQHDIARQKAEDENINLCQDHRREQRDSLREWMLETTRHLNTLRDDRQKLSGLIADREMLIEELRGPQKSHASDYQAEIAEFKTEVEELDQKIEKLESQWHEARTDKRAITESMKQP